MRSRNIKIILGVILAILVIVISYRRINYHQSAQAFSSDFAVNEDNGYKKSEFVKFNGNDYYDIGNKDIKKINYQYSWDLARGEITLKLIVNNEEVWSSDKHEGKSINNGEIAVHDRGNIKLRVIGKNATGKYKFEWQGK